MQHFELKNSFDDYLLTNDGVKSLFGRKHMKLFLARNQFFFKEIIIQNKPFKKKIPIFFFNLKNKTTNYKLKTKECKNYFKKNISIYNNHFQKQIDKIINKQQKKNKIFIFGENFLSQYTLNYIKNKKKKNVINIKNKSEYLYNDTNQLNTILSLAEMNSNIFFIFENPNEGKIKKSLVNRFHINIKNSVYFLDNRFEYEKDVFSFEQKNFLKKKINLIKN